MALSLHNQPATPHLRQHHSGVRCLRGAGAVALLAAAARCYTGPINSPPNKPDITVPQPIARTQPATFTASTSDPDGDRVRLKWASAPGPCDPQALPVPGAATSDTFTVTPMTDAD